MAKPFDERFSSAMGAGARASDVEALIAEAEQKLAQVRDCEAEARRLSLDPATPIGDAQHCKSEAHQCEFAAQRLAGQIDALTTRLTQLKESAAAQSRLKEYEAAAAESAALAGEIKQIYPRALADLTSLFQRIEANDARIEKANASKPGGRPHLISAEVQARGCQGNWYWGFGIDAVQRLTKLKLPFLDKRGLAWPPEPINPAAAIIDFERRDREARRRQEQQRAAAQAKRERTRARYAVKAVHGGNSAVPFAHADGSTAIWRGSAVFDFYADQVEPTRSAGFELKRVAADTPLGSTSD